MAKALYLQGKIAKNVTPLIQNWWIGADTQPQSSPARYGAWKNRLGHIHLSLSRHEGYTYDMLIAL